LAPLAPTAASTTTCTCVYFAAEDAASGIRLTRPCLRPPLPRLQNVFEPPYNPFGAPLFMFMLVVPGGLGVTYIAYKVGMSKMKSS
jgi:hypothetical protein